jgi:Cof subfamily protein (haloacid dehalogenase superfamily)
VKTLYVTDLDGTLLNCNDSLSEYTVKTINNLMEIGMCFSYATARSLSSASIVTKGLKMNNPVIIYNGSFIVNPNTNERLFSLYFNEQEKEIIKNFLINHSVYPLVYGNINTEEKVSWIKSKANNGINHYKNSRKGDKRLRPVETIKELYQGELFYFTCISDKKEQLMDIFDYFKGKAGFNCTIQKELYREEYWCEIMPGKATKGNAIMKLKEVLNCDKIITFGDAINDIPMFKMSDESYAVENAVDELKEYANGIIKSNKKDGVANWLEENYFKNGLSAHFA